MVTAKVTWVFIAIFYIRFLYFGYLPTRRESPMSEENTATNTSLTALLAKAKAKRVSDCCKHPPNYIPYTHTFYTTD